MAEYAIGFNHLFTLGIALFVIGLAGFLVRRNLIIMFLCTEIMFQGVVVTVVAFGRFHANLTGQAFAIFLLVIAAVEAALGLGLVVLMFRRSNTLDSEAWRTMKEV
jgi:NADH-quinone oxidoreductase subunit K